MPRTGKRERSIGDPAVRAVVDATPEPARAQLLALRALILETAAATPGVGRIEETLKWGQPSYLTPETKSGTTIRIDAVRDDPGRVALYVHCQTNLVDRFRELYPDDLGFEGNRAVLIDADAPLPEAALRHCIGLALTYHAEKRRR